jgi:Family of unknown function (DUF5719)
VTADEETSGARPEDAASGAGQDVASDAGGEPRPPRPARRHARPPVRGRWAVAISLATVVVVVGVVAVAVPVPGAAPPPAGSDGIGLAPADAQSSSAFCTAGAGTSIASTIYLTNTTAHPVAASMTTVAASTGGPAASVQRLVTVPPLGTAAVDPGQGMAAGSTATSFAFVGGGVSADQVVAGPSGWSMAPCASELSSEWAFAGGSTTTGDSLALALFNPSASPASVNLTFLTAHGVMTPQPYQGVLVGAGKLVVENVGDYVQDVPAIATIVSAESGAVVSDELQQTTSSGLSLRLGSPDLSSTWQFAQNTVLAGSSLAFDLANPGATPVTATLSAGLPAATVMPKSVEVPPQSIVVFHASSAPGWPVGTPYSVSVRSSGPIVVGRAVNAAPGALSPTWGSSSGTTAVSDQWWVPGPGVPGAPGVAGATTRSLAVSDPGSAPVQVVVEKLGGGQVAAFTVAPGALRVLGQGTVGGLRVFRVTASAPVSVEADSGPNGAPGIVAFNGFPSSGGG